MFNHNYLLIIIFNLIFLDKFIHLASGQVLDLGCQSPIILNDKIYFFGGYSNFTADYVYNLTNQIIYIDLSSSFSLNKPLPIKQQIVPKSAIPPFNKATLALGGASNDTLYVIAGVRNPSPAVIDINYGSMVYSINTNSFDTWTSQDYNG